MELLKIMKKLLTILRNLFTVHKRSNIECNADAVMTKHAKTLLELDSYDRGEIQKSVDMVKYPRVREYLREIQKVSAASNFRS